jgi:hypothetical protein
LKHDHEWERRWVEIAMAEYEHVVTIGFRKIDEDDERNEKRTIVKEIERRWW